MTATMPDLNELLGNGRPKKDKGRRLSQKEKRHAAHHIKKMKAHLDITHAKVSAADSTIGDLLAGCIELGGQAGDFAEFVNGLGDGDPAADNGDDGDDDDL